VKDGCFGGVPWTCVLFPGYLRLWGCQINIHIRAPEFFDGCIHTGVLLVDDFINSMVIPLLWQAAHRQIRKVNEKHTFSPERGILLRLWKPGHPLGTMF